MSMIHRIRQLEKAAAVAALSAGLAISREQFNALTDEERLSYLRGQLPLQVTGPPPEPPLTREQFGRLTDAQRLAYLRGELNRAQALAGGA